MGQHDAQPAGVGGFRAGHRPASVPGVVQPQIVGQARSGVHDGLVGHRGERDRAAAVGLHGDVDGHVDPAARQHDERSHHRNGDSQPGAHAVGAPRVMGSFIPVRRTDR
ncbi:MAG: hypothetical protein V9E89_06040 [Ilumatobacteraceae bacterium]